MKILTTISLLLLFAGTLSAQVNFKVTLSQKHQQKVERAKDARTKLKRYKKLYRKEEKRLMKLREDSLSSVRLNADSLLVATFLPDSATREDSIEWALNTLAQHHQYSEIREFYSNINADSGLHRPNLDSMIVEEVVHEIASAFVPQELQGVDPADPVKTFTKDLPFDPSGSPGEQVDALQSKLEGRTLQEVAGIMSKYKRKFIAMPDLSKPSEGIKRKSLQGSPLKNRFYLGGNVAVQATYPLVLDLDFLLGFKINKDFSFGAGFVWREAFGKLDSASSSLNRDTHGYSLFADHMLIKSFFLYAEFASFQNRAFFNSERSDRTIWQYEALAGVGRKFKLRKWAEMNIMFLYDFNHRQNDLHPRPYMIKVGYRVTGKLFDKKKNK